MIYFIADSHYVKVGYAKDIGNRVSSLQCANPRPYTLIASCEGDEALEMLLHKNLPGRVDRDREWFHITPIIIDLVLDIAKRGEVAIHDHIDTMKAARQDGKRDWSAHDKQFHEDLSSVFRALKDRHGGIAIAEIMGCVENMINKYCRGESVPSGPRLLRLFNAFPELYERFPAFKAAQAAITNMMLQAEGIRA